MTIEHYLAELKKITLLTREEETLLWQQYKEAGDLESRRRLIENYQPLVFKAAARFRTDHPAIMDMIQEGTVGLIEAAESYQHTRGVAFSLYAKFRIQGRIMNYLEREGKKNWTYIDSPAEGEESGTLGEYLMDTAPAVSQQAEYNYMLEQVRQAMQRLPAKEQLVLSGVFLEEQEPKELAETLDMSISHIYRLQKQGIRRIRGILSKFMQNW